jgi:hypothetical protein
MAVGAGAGLLGGFIYNPLRLETSRIVAAGYDADR